MEVTRNFTDAELLANLRSGVRMNEMIRCLYRDHYKSLSWYVLHNSGTSQDAEDVFQEVVVTFIELVEKDRFREESTIKTFLFSLNRHIWLNELKKRGRALTRAERFEESRERVELEPLKNIRDRENRTLIMDLMARLGDHCRQILLLFYYENLPMKEILDVMHYENEQVLRNKKYKCLKQLELMLGADPRIKALLKNALHGT